MKKNLMRMLTLGTIAATGLVGSGCAGVYESDPMFQVLGEVQEVFPTWAQSAGWKEYKENEIRKQEEMKKAEEMKTEILTSKWRSIKIINGDTNKLEADVGGSGDSWPDYVGRISNFYNETGQFPENGYKVFKFESSRYGQEGVCIEDFTVIRQEKNGISFYKKVESEE